MAAAGGDVVGVDYEPQRGYRPKPGPWKSSMFRLVYGPPPAAACAALRQGALVWHGRLPSRAFGGGRVD